MPQLVTVVSFRCAQRRGNTVRSYRNSPAALLGSEEWGYVTDYDRQHRADALHRAPPVPAFPRKPNGRSRKPSGTIPDWLRGEVVRTCPVIFETNGWRAQHWFDGLGMIYAFASAHRGSAHV